MQTYTDGRPEGHLRSREVSLIAAGHRRGNIGFRQMGRIQNLKNNPMHSSRQEAGRPVAAQIENGRRAKSRCEEFDLNI
jgi:hypothetical protein